MDILTPSHLQYINQHLAQLEPQQILQWACITLPNLYQTSALGLTGLAAMDMLDKMHVSLPLIFLDTLYHFPQTLALVDRVRARYPLSTPFHIYHPNRTSTTAEFEAQYGPEFWVRDEATYDYLVKVEPAQRAYKELGVRAVITGRRRSQGGKRGICPWLRWMIRD